MTTLTTLFVVCAVLGGTVLALQFLLTFLGLTGHAIGIDAPHDVGHDLGGLGHDFGSDFHGDAGVDVHGADGAGHAGAAGAAHEHGGQPHEAGHGSTLLFRMISVRTVVAALTFFGLTGLVAQAAELSTTVTLAVAVAAGAGALYGVYMIMQGMMTLDSEGTARIHRAVGHQATVYLRIPAGGAGAGKIQINLQNRTMEYLATTPGGEIPTGATVVVSGVVDAGTVTVQPVLQPERDTHA